MLQSKEKLLKQVDSLRDLARRSRRLSEEVRQRADQETLLRYSNELEDVAVRLEREAAEAKTMPQAGSRQFQAAQRSQSAVSGPSRSDPTADEDSNTDVKA